MNVYSKLAMGALYGMLLGMPAAQAEPPKTLQVDLGTWESDFAIYPQNLSVKAGEEYRIVLVNWSRQHRHVVMAPEFERAVTTKAIRTYPERVQVRGAGFGNGINVPPGERVEVYFVPNQEGRYKLLCQDRIHTDAGMELAIDVRR